MHPAKKGTVLQIIAAEWRMQSMRWSVLLQHAVEMCRCVGSMQKV